ncbi:MAG TPA: hypothetical protein VGC54_07525 [Planctomycetota bacterium]
MARIRRVGISPFHLSLLKIVVCAVAAGVIVVMLYYVLAAFPSAADRARFEGRIDLVFDRATGTWGIDQDARAEGLRAMREVRHPATDLTSPIVATTSFLAGLLIVAAVQTVRMFRRG